MYAELSTVTHVCFLFSHMSVWLSIGEFFTVEYTCSTPMYVRRRSLQFFFIDRMNLSLIMHQRRQSPRHEKLLGDGY
jgi:hypothetical protein